MPDRLPSQEYLRKILDYDPEAGVLIWRPRDPSMFREFDHWKRWTARFAGKRAFACNDGGYPRGRLGYVSVRAHRVIWKWMTGEEPEQIDHINGVRSDNSWANLRAATNTSNNRNRATSRCNTSGRTGVYFEKRSGKWRAAITIGTFANKEDAIRAREAAERVLGYHENHGRQQVAQSSDRLLKALLEAA